MRDIDLIIFSYINKFFVYILDVEVKILIID